MVPRSHTIEDRREIPIYYASRQMSLAERKYTTKEREALAVVYACIKIWHDLLGYRIVFHTDHDSLKHLMNKPDLSVRIAKWILLLQEFNYEVVVKPQRPNLMLTSCLVKEARKQSQTLYHHFRMNFRKKYESSIFLEASHPSSRISLDISQKEDFRPECQGRRKWCFRRR